MSVALAPSLCRRRGQWLPGPASSEGHRGTWSLASVTTPRLPHPEKHRECQEGPTCTAW